MTTPEAEDQRAHSGPRREFTRSDPPKARLRDAVRLTIPVPGRPEYTYRIEHIHKRITTPPDASLDLQSDLLALAIVRHDRLTLPLILKEDE